MAVGRDRDLPEMIRMRVLAVAPHTDDLELGCGGTLSRLIRAGCEIAYVAFSVARESVPEGLPKDVLGSEARVAAERLGLSTSMIHIHDFPVRRFPSVRQEILDFLVSFRRQVSPDLVLIPSTSDIHQDHAVVCQEAIRAFKLASLLGYELYWNEISTHPFSSALFVELCEEDVKRKLNSLEAYQSQKIAGRKYMDADLVRSHLRVRGLQAGVEYAEAFEVIRWVLRA